MVSLKVFVHIAWRMGILLKRVFIHIGPYPFVKFWRIPVKTIQRCIKGSLLSLFWSDNLPRLSPKKSILRGYNRIKPQATLNTIHVGKNVSSWKTKDFFYMWTKKH
jgi:hypothetical protein